MLRNGHVTVCLLFILYEAFRLADCVSEWYNETMNNGNVSFVADEARKYTKWEKGVFDFEDDGPCTFANS